MIFYCPDNGDNNFEVEEANPGDDRITFYVSLEKIKEWEPINLSIEDARELVIFLNKQILRSK